ncbi:DUF2997 domain-containing protein [Micromonospora sp. R77]|uniref:DUF2997 domain-containing protein n=1 Tax=Micromonospora sp. R77 TaxID=2925836 RepID=UPI001F60CC70|nr:DUF2997 domain-containing protein [Micromonospora sp. R77]MCI4064542.1 DUF2997 domain-containing protein [Micromonospora sp. R77]
MSDRPRVEVTVHPDGSVTAQTHDVLGERCLDYVAVLEDLLAARAVDSAYTADLTRTAVTGWQEERDVDRA